MQERRDLVDRGAAPRDVRGGRKRADPHAALVLGQLEQLLEVGEVDPAVVAQVDLDDRGEALAPGDLIGVVFVRPDEDDGLACLEVRGELLVGLLPERRSDHARELGARCRRQRDADDLLQLVDRARRARSDADDAPVRAGVDRILDRGLGLLEQARHRAAGDIVLGVRVGVDALQALNVALYDRQAAPGRRVVGINHEPVAERRGHGCVGADDAAPEIVKIQRFSHRFGSPPKAVVRLKS